METLIPFLMVLGIEGDDIEAKDAELPANMLEEGVAHAVIP